MPSKVTHLNTAESDTLHSEQVLRDSGQNVPQRERREEAIDNHTIRLCQPRLVELLQQRPFRAEAERHDAEVLAQQRKPLVELAAVVDEEALCLLGELCWLVFKKLLDALL